MKTYQENLAIYETPTMRIGKHEWKCVVYRHDIYGACTNYHWRNPDNLDMPDFQECRAWPNYDGNDTYNGLPRSLIKLYRKYEAEIEAALVTGKKYHAA